MKSAGQYKFPKALSDTDLRRFTAVFGLYCFNPRSSVESVVNALFDNCRESSTNRPFFCKTKPICRGCKMKVNSVLTKAYEGKARVARQSKQSQTNPIQAKANVKMGKLYFSQWRTPPTFVGAALPLRRQGCLMRNPGQAKVCRLFFV